MTEENYKAIEFQKTKPLLIGIDPGANTGFAYYIKGRSYVEINTYSFWEAIDRIKLMENNFGKEGIGVIIENPDLNKPIFQKRKRNDRRDLRVAQNVGMNKRDAQLLIEYLKRNKIDYIAIQPVKSKMTSEFFSKITEYKLMPEGTTRKITQHEIDAANLIPNLPQKGFKK